LSPAQRQSETLRLAVCLSLFSLADWSLKLLGIVNQRLPTALSGQSPVSDLRNYIGSLKTGCCGEAKLHVAGCLRLIQDILRRKPVSAHLLVLEKLASASGPAQWDASQFTNARVS